MVFSDLDFVRLSCEIACKHIKYLLVCASGFVNACQISSNAHGMSRITSDTLIHLMSTAWTGVRAGIGVICSHTSVTFITKIFSAKHLSTNDENVTGTNQKPSTKYDDTFIKKKKTWKTEILRRDYQTQQPTHTLQSQSSHVWTKACKSEAY